MSLSVFDPVKYSIEENQWLLRHLGEPWAVAGKDIVAERLPNPARSDKNPVWYPNGVNPNAVRPIIEAVFELIQVEKADGTKWVGVQVLKEAIVIYLALQEKWQRDKKRGAPRFPSLASYDSKGRPHLGGAGSDSGQVKTYFDNEGNRQKLAVDLVPSGQLEWVAEWAVKAGENADKPEAGLVVNNELGRIECFCGHVEKFNVDSRGSFRAARARISKHLRGDKKMEFVEQHRELHTAEFGGR